MAPRSPAVGDRVELEFLDPTRNARRYYALVVADDPQLGLFGEDRGVVLVVVRGRLEGRRIVVREAFGDLDRLARRWRALLRKRVRRGYRVTSRVVETAFGPVVFRGR